MAYKGKVGKKGAGDVTDRSRELALFQEPAFLSDDEV